MEINSNGQELYSKVGQSSHPTGQRDGMDSTEKVGTTSDLGIQI